MKTWGIMDKIKRKGVRIGEYIIRIDNRCKKERNENKYRVRGGLYILVGSCVEIFGIWDVFLGVF
jgi:hypothetical protein